MAMVWHGGKGQCFIPFFIKTKHLFFDYGSLCFLNTALVNAGGRGIHRIF